MNDNLISEIIDLNKVKANLMELQKMWEQLIATMAAKSSKDLKFDDLAQNLKTVTTAEAELAKTKQASFEVDKQKVKITAEIIANYDKYGKEEQKIIENEIKRKAQVSETNKLLKDKFTNEQDLTKVLQRETKSIADLDKQNKDLQRIQQKLNLTTKEGLDANEKINAQISKNKETIKQYTNEIDKQRRNVGNYQEAVDTANMSLGEMKKELLALRNMSFAGLKPEEIKQVRDRMAELTDGIGDFQAQIKTASADKIPALVNGLQGLIAVAQGVTGTLAMFGIESEKLNKTMVQLIGVSQALKTAQELQEKGTIKVMLATVKDTAAKTANAVAAKGQAMATNGATAATRALGRVMKSNPYTAIAAAAAAAVAAIVALVKALGEQNSAMKKVIENANKATGEIKSEQFAMNQLFAAIKKANVGSTERKKLIDEINELYGDYLPSLLDEKMSLEDINKAQIAANDSLKANILMKAKRQELESVEAKLAKLYAEQREELEKFDKISSGATRRIGLWFDGQGLKIGDKLAKNLERLNNINNRISEQEQLWQNIAKYYDDQMPQQVELTEEQKKELEEQNRLLEEQRRLLEEQKKAKEEAKRRYQDYVGSIAKANEEAKLQIALGESDCKVRVKQLEAIYSATKAYYELNGYTADEIKKLKELRAEIDKLNTEIDKPQNDLKAFEKSLSDLKKLQTQELTAKNIEFLNSQRAIHEEMSNGLLTVEEYQEKLEQLEFEHFINSNKQQIEQLEKLNETLKETDFTEYQKNLEKIAQLKNELAKSSFSVVKIEPEEVEKVKTLKDYFKEIFGSTKPIEDWRDTFKESISQVVYESLNLFNEIIEMQSNQLEQELENINIMYDKQVSTLDDAYEKRKSLLEATIDDEEELAEALARIEEEKTATYNKMQDEKIAKEQEVAKKRAILEKKRVSMEVAAGSATSLIEAIKLIGIATTTATPGDPYSVAARIAAALAAALTVVSAVTTGIAKVKAIQIPEFWAGGEAQEGQLISVAERGRELAIGESGQTYMFDKHSVLFTPEKMRIFSNKETNKIMEKQTINNTYEKQSNVNLTIAIDNERHKKYFKLN